MARGIWFADCPPGRGVWRGSAPPSEVQPCCAPALLGADPTGAWILAAVAGSIGILHTVPSSLLIGAQEWRAASLVGLVTGAVATGAGVAVLAAGGGITGLFAVEAASSALNLTWTTLLARRFLAELPETAEPVDELQRQVVRYALPATLGVLLTFVVWRRSEFFFLSATRATPKSLCTRSRSES